MAVWIKMPLGVKVGLGPGDFVLDGTQLPQKGAPLFSAHVYCGQTAIKMPLGMEVGLGQSDIVLVGDPAPPKKGGVQPPPIFGPFLLWPNGCMYQDTTWYGGRPQPRRRCVRRTQLPLP